MTRILVADDEQPVVDGISHIVRRDLSAECEVVGTASSGREAIEKAAALSPDIVLMDVSMPGLSGLDAIREIRRRGSASAFILITAYERFDIAREAVELGVVDYLLKPVSKDKLALSLRSAAGIASRKAEVELREIEHREREEGMRSFVEEAFLQSLMLGARSPAEIQRYRSALGITEPLCALAAVAFLPPQGALDPESEVRASYEALRGAVRYKTRALAGPLVSGLCAVLLPVREGEEGAMAGLLAAIEAALSAELSRGRIRLGLGEQLPLAEAGSSWSGALARLLAPEAEGDDAGNDAGNDAQGASSAGLGFEEDEAFLEALLSSPERASLELERILGSLRGPSEPSLAGRYRLVVLLGSALRSLGLRGLLSPAEAGGAMNFDDLRLASGSGGLELAVRARLAALLAAAARVERRSSPVRAAVERIKESFDKPITLDFVADELALAPSRLSRLFIEETGKGFSDFLIEYRIERAKEMLAQPGATIKRVSAACGYPDPNYFSRLFKKVTGLTPSTLIPKGEGDER